ncbi:hypothetical protein HB763_19335 [Vibrio campbellii]|uniref:hypothetical protein n=1 Tax=Vibrio campbellii TaxID=680 RepID=UPI00210ECF8D|nr:hypothetical protein [Vibrio campbellii]UTZ38760.1 hypothetical protein HB763_19335 [Vibrio campbellii]
MRLYFKLTALFFLISTPSFFSNAEELLPVTKVTKVTSISVGVDGSWFLDSDEGWGLQGCESVTTLKIAQNHPQKHEYIQLLSLNLGNDIRLKANASCDSENSFIINAGKFITRK